MSSHKNRTTSLPNVDGLEERMVLTIPFHFPVLYAPKAPSCGCGSHGHDNGHNDYGHKGGGLLGSIVHLKLNLLSKFVGFRSR